jgi:hypothetical protein
MPIVRLLLGCCFVLWTLLAMPAPALCEPGVTILYTAETNGKIKGCPV